MRVFFLCISTKEGRKDFSRQIEDTGFRVNRNTLHNASSWAFVTPLSTLIFSYCKSHVYIASPLNRSRELKLSCEHGKAEMSRSQQLRLRIA
jgi:hypothetical protein